MKRVTAVVVLLVAMLAVGGVAVAAHGKNARVKASVSIKFKGGNDPYYEQASFSGKLKAKGKSNHLRKKCTKQRKVKIVAKNHGTVVGKAVTNGKGRYATGVNRAFKPGAKYLAKVKRQIYKKKRHGKLKKRIVCKKTKSKVITAG